jgi:putative ABC transport system permease protein
VAPRYFHAMGIPLHAGRDFTAADDGSGEGVAIVSESFARRFWKTTDVIGRHVRPEFSSSTAFWIPRATKAMLRIVGVAGDVREDGTPGAGYPQIYLPYAQDPTTVITLIARTSHGSAAHAAGAIRDAVRAADPQLPVSDEKTFGGVMADSFARPREIAWLVATFAALALVLSAVGVYGVMAHLAAARTQEIGIRIALGAGHGDVVWLIVGQAVRLALVGAAIGAVCTPFALRLAGGLLFGVGRFDPVTLAAVAIVLTLVAALAAAIPAHRSARTLIR